MSTHFAASPTALAPVDLPGALNYHHDIDPAKSTGLKAAKAMMESALADAVAFNERRAMVDETITAAANLAVVGALADKLADKTLKAFGKADADLSEATAVAEQNLALATGLKAPDNAGELRSVLRSMSSADRQRAVIQAFKAHDRDVIGAVVGQNALLHGIDTSLVGELFEIFQREAAPAEFANVAEHRKAQDYLTRARPSLLGWMRRMHQGTGSHATRKAAFDAIMVSYGFAD